MKLKLLLAVCAAALAVPAAVAPAQAQRAAAQRDWTRTVVATAEGGFMMGNPNAPVKVVEFVSLTCPHCAHFSVEGAPQLIRDHVRTGRVSFEIRPFPLDIIAATAAQLTRCAGPAEAFALNDAILAGQAEMFARIEDLTEADVGAIDALEPGERRLRIAALTGIDAIAARHGVDAGEARACLSDQAGADRIDSIKAAAELIGVGGTPSFAINGELAMNVHDWTALEPLLRATR
jgi:protein-disulfide isomerase